MASAQPDGDGRGLLGLRLPLAGDVLHEAKRGFQAGVLWTSARAAGRDPQVHAAEGVEDTLFGKDV